MAGEETHRCRLKSTATAYEMMSIDMNQQSKLQQPTTHGGNTIASIKTSVEQSFRTSNPSYVGVLNTTLNALHAWAEQRRTHVNINVEYIIIIKVRNDDESETR